MPDHAGQLIVDSLKQHGVERVFLVPGESYLAVLDGLHDSGIEPIVCRHEGGAGYMAEAHGKFTGHPGVALVTRGPGAANAVIAVHTAWQDATPLVVFVGLVPLADRQHEAFQEFDLGAWFNTQTKRVLILDQAERASEVVAEAFHAARSGRPGPVVVGLPEDIVSQAATQPIQPPLPVTQGAVSTADLNVLADALAQSKRPLLLLGGPGWDAVATQTVTQFAEHFAIPVMHDWRASDRVPFNSPANAGWLGYGRSEAAARIFDQADTLISIGALPTDVPTDGYTLRQSPDATHIAVNIDPALRGRSGNLSHHICATPTAFAHVLVDLPLEPSEQWSQWCQAAHAAQQAYARLPEPATLPDIATHSVHVEAVLAEVLDYLPDDAIYCFGAGNHCLWAQRYCPTHVYPSQLSVRNGAMGYSIPAATTAALAAPERTVVAIAGDGEFGMNGQELATAVQHGAAMLVLVLDNGQFATIRDHQEKHFPGRISGTQLHNPDFAALARAYGCHGETLNDDRQIAPAVASAFAAMREQHRPALLHLIVDPHASLPAE